MRRTIGAILLLIVAAFALAPLVHRLQAERAELQYGKIGVTHQIRAQIGQGMAIGLLAGFRGVVADFLWIQNHGFWENKEWLRMYRNMELTTTLQPQSVTFWDVSAWHMAWNIGYAVRIDAANRTAAEGLKREREWQEKAREFLAAGIQNVPGRYDLYFSMGWLYWKKFKQPCAARDYFYQASRFADAPSYTLRMYARAWEECGDKRGAYLFWKKLWRNGKPEPFADAIDARTVIARELRRLEQELNVPREERAFPDVITNERQDDR
jgi:hypothetical protein